MRVFMLGAIAGAALALGVTSIDGDRRAEADDRSVVGAGEAGLVDERFRFDTRSGTGHVSTSLRRVLVKVPRAYGNLAGVSGGERSSVLWFQGQDGTVRNVIVEGGALYQVEHEAQ